MKNPRNSFSKPYYFTLILAAVIFCNTLCYGQNKPKSNSALCKQLTIDAAQYGKASYTYSKMGYFISNQKLAQRNIDTAVYLIKVSISCLDSAILLAADSELLGIDYCNMAKKNAALALRTLRSFAKYTRLDQKQQLAKDASVLSAKVVIDSYNASFYFIDDTPPEKPVTPPVKDTLPKQITKLDIDQALFALLDEQLIEKEEKNKKEISKLETQLKATKDPAKTAQLKAQIKKLEQNETEVEKKDKETKEKLTNINTQLDEREKNKTAETKTETNAFSKSLNRPADDWNKQVLLDSELPMGLVYQVQIGVYKNPVTAETFKGITPIFGKTTAAGITYSAGIFEKVGDAKQAKDYVVSMGLHDAFVIAYHDKKRISLAEAAKLEKK